MPCDRLAGGGSGRSGGRPGARRHRRLWALAPGDAVPRPDLIIVARGGGSVEDLWPFNDENLARAAAASTIPLISAVGHETDTTLIDFVSDRRAPTPTAAAEMATPVFAELAAGLADYERRIIQCGSRIITHRRDRLLAAGGGLPRPNDLLAIATQRLDIAAGRLGAALQKSHRRPPARPRRLRRAAQAGASAAAHPGEIRTVVGSDHPPRPGGAPAHRPGERRLGGPRKAAPVVRPQPALGPGIRPRSPQGWAPGPRRRRAGRRRGGEAGVRRRRPRRGDRWGGALASPKLVRSDGQGPRQPLLTQGVGTLRR